MNEGLVKKMDEVIDRSIDKMKLIDPEEEGYKDATERLTALYKLKIEESQAESETQIKSQQLAEAKKDRWIKLGVDIAGILLPIGFYGIWMARGFKFEQTGSYTSTTFRGLFNRFKPTR